MRKLVLAAAVLAVAGFALPTSAATCDAEMKTVKADWSKATDIKKKDAALAHTKAAEQALARKDEKACLDSLGKARAAMK
ncbi:MAG: hypothetical protein EXQ92_09585 [Alphaproteobacteria bacterium]|nr:hypothetical protein [Alphaproteobacteria bacterium]